MKAFLQHDESGLFYRHGGEWVLDPVEALAFSNAKDAEHFLHSEEIRPAHAVLRIDPALLTRRSRAPGAYQIGE
jgi:hypothetical protein